MNPNQAILVLLTAGMMAMPVHAGDFDGSKPLVCATIEARDCVLGAACYTGEAKTVGAPSFIHIDFANKTMIGEKSSSPIASMEASETQLLLQGTEQGYGWAMALNLESGDFSASLTNTDGSFLMFGTCTVD